jgi:DUF917 family protein
LEGDLVPLATGAAILGTGGGGDPYYGRLLAREAIRKCGPLQLVDPERLKDDDLVISLALMGAPTVMVEKLPRGDELVASVHALETRIGAKADHLMALEVGGLNSLTPISAAVQLGRPLVDADLMGRAFPELQMCLPTVFDRSAGPLAVSDERGQTAVLSGSDSLSLERIARSIVVHMGCVGALAAYPMTGREVKEMSVWRTMSLCLELGHAVERARRAHQDPIAAALEILDGYVLFRGKVTDVARRTVGGFARMQASIDGFDEWVGHEMKLETQNEHLIAIRDGTTIASVPDLICVFEAEKGDAVTTESLRYGARVVVCAAPCDARWRSPEGLQIVGPHAFGYEGVMFVPIEEAVAQPAQVG